MSLNTSIKDKLRGAFYGFSNIPDRWIVDLKGKERLETVYLAFEGVITA